MIRLAWTLAFLLVWPAAILLLAGDAGWVEGWIFGAWFVVMSASCVLWLYVKDPALLAERYRRPGSGGQSGEDQLIVYLLGLGFVAWVALMPLDGRRFGWSPALPLGLRVAGGALLAPSWYLFQRAFMDNTYASPLARLQTEREHRVVSTGVYALVRHPMYLGAALMFVGAPLLTGALTALAAGVALTLLLAVRIRGEETLLAEGLPGYEDYRRRVRYRLLPYVWIVALAPAAWADETCVRIGAGTAVYDRPGAEAAVGKATAAVTGFVVERGAWYSVRVENVSPRGRYHVEDGDVTVAVPRAAVKPARCPVRADLHELGLIDDFLQLEWKDGTRAGWTHTVAAVEPAARSRERVVAGGEPHVCFDYTVVAALTVHVCGACGRLRKMAGHVLSLDGEKREPCAD